MQCKMVPCPACGADSVFAPSNPFRPFCGERCKSLDLGAWADEAFRVPVRPEAEDAAPEAHNSRQ
ncbi:DNA gyrase inhibitor YacG [Rhodoferax sp.]|uniref:DNA gyrase inhibitor YacG n=1 Tax=Rhodoferax sp. TaxID=50421 RepID=UPI003782F84F